MHNPFGYNAIKGLLYGAGLFLIGWLFAGMMQAATEFPVENFPLLFGGALWILSFTVGYVKDTKQED